jgi:small subunit ribosomal protein S33
MSIAAFIPPSRVASLTKLRCAIFQTSFNPSSTRTGAKYLKRRLQGPSMVAYYPEDFNIKTIAKAYPELEIVDDDEEDRLLNVADRKRKGKGAPKKAKTKGWRMVFFFFSRFSLC